MEDRCSRVLPSDVRPFSTPYPSLKRDKRGVVGWRGCGRMEGVWHVGGVWQDGRGTVTQSLLEQYFKCTGFSIAGGQVSWTGNGDGTKCISHYIAHWCPH